MAALAAVIRSQIEAQLAQRVPGALSPLQQQAPRLVPTGRPEVDRMLNGGLPMGSLCEVTGIEGSGLTSIALSLLASASRDGACAYVDVSDTLSPHCAAAAGVPLTNLLWVRFAEAVQRATTPITQSAAIAIDTHREQKQLAQQHCGSPHPRGETKNLAPALQQVLACNAERRERKKEGTPGYPNQPIGLHTASKEQVDWERFNIRRVDETDPLRQMDHAAAEAARQRAAVKGQQMQQPLKTAKPWNRLDGALRATDQILQAGGFGAVVLDLSSLPVEQAQRVPSATWWRFQKAAQKGDAIVLLLTQQPCAHSSAACVLHCTPEAQFQVQGVLSAATRTVEAARQRTAPMYAKKAPGRATEWNARPHWMHAAGL